MLHKLVFDSKDRRLGCFNGTTHNYWLWQPIPVRYRMRGRTILIFVESYKEG